MIVNRPEDTSRLDGHHAHSKLAPRHALDLRAKVDRCQQLHRDTLRLSAACSLLIGGSSLFPVHRKVGSAAPFLPAGVVELGVVDAGAVEGVEQGAGADAHAALRDRARALANAGLREQLARARSVL